MQEEKNYPTTPDAEGWFFNTKEDETNGIKSRNYPTAANAEGFFFQDHDEYEMGVETKEYESGSRIKRFKLSDGTECITRKLRGRDSVDAQEKAGKNKKGEMNQARYMLICAAKATKFNDKELLPEELENLWLSDFNKVTAVNAFLNF